MLHSKSYFFQNKTCHLLNHEMLLDPRGQADGVSLLVAVMSADGRSTVVFLCLSFLKLDEAACEVVARKVETSR